MGPGLAGDSAEADTMVGTGRPQGEHNGRWAGSAPTPWATPARLASAPGLFPSGNRLCSLPGCPRDDRAQRTEQRSSPRGFPVQQGRAGPRSARPTHLSLRLGAGGTAVQTPRAGSSARAPYASSLRARSRPVPIGCVLRKPTNTVAPRYLSPPPCASGAGSPRGAEASRVPNTQS